MSTKIRGGLFITLFNFCYLFVCLFFGASITPFNTIFFDDRKFRIIKTENGKEFLSKVTVFILFYLGTSDLQTIPLPGSQF